MSKSPFPGMDPWLESRWPEVHASLIVYARNQINSQLPGDLQANIEQNLQVYAEDDHSAVRPDINVSEDASFSATSESSPGVAIAEPMIVKGSPHRARNLEIVGPDGRVITAIEFISPWNKVGSLNRESYARKQLDYFDAKVNLVEIDLVRQGRYVLAAPHDELQMFLKGQSPYLICVCREKDPTCFEVYRAPLDEPLPNIPIPLRRGERDIVLQLQPLIDQCYHDGRYHRLSYNEPPRGKFECEQADWIEQRLRQQGRRK